MEKKSDLKLNRIIVVYNVETVTKFQYFKKWTVMQPIKFIAKFNNFLLKCKVKARQELVYKVLLRLPAIFVLDQVIWPCQFRNFSILYWFLETKLTLALKLSKTGTNLVVISETSSNSGSWNAIFILALKLWIMITSTPVLISFQNQFKYFNANVILGHVDWFLKLIGNQFKFVQMYF